MTVEPLASENQFLQIFWHNSSSKRHWRTRGESFFLDKVKVRLGLI